MMGFEACFEIALGLSRSSIVTGLELVGDGEDVLDEAAFLSDESAVSTPALPPATACLLLPIGDPLFREQLVKSSRVTSHVLMTRATEASSRR